MLQVSSENTAFKNKSVGCSKTDTAMTILFYEQPNHILWPQNIVYVLLLLYITFLWQTCMTSWQYVCIPVKISETKELLPFSFLPLQNPEVCFC